MMVALLALTGCGDANEKENAKDSGAKVEDVTNGTQESIGKKTTAEDIEIVKEYLYADGFGATYHFVVVKNNGATPVAIKTSTKAYKNDGSSLDVDFVEGYALFIKDGKLVDWKSSYGGKMEPGKTIENKLTTFKEYDDIEIYLTGGIM